MAFIQFSSIQFEYNQWKTAPFKIFFQRKCRHLFAIFKKRTQHSFIGATNLKLIDWILRFFF
jgi:hypothetical protein